MSGSTARLGLVFAGVFSVLGITVPYYGLWLEKRGLDEAEISLVFAVATWARALLTPVVGNLADRSGRHKQWITRCALAALLATAALLLDLGFVWVFAFVLLSSVLYMPTIPLVDALVVRDIQARSDALPAGARRPDYARLRIWGSAAFLIVALAAGAFLEGRDREWILYLMLATHALAFAASTLLPRVSPREQDRAPPGGFLRLLARRELILLFVAVALIQGSHGCYYAFGSIWWERVGHSRDFIGVLWSEGVLAEILFFALIARAISIRPKTLLQLGALAAMLRWTVLAISYDAWALISVQWLHAFTFGATHLAAMRWIQAEVAPERVATAQSLLATIGAGLGPGLAISISGPLFERYEAQAYFAMVALAGAGAVIALFLPRARTTKANT